MANCKEFFLYVPGLANSNDAVEIVGHGIEFLDGSIAIRHLSVEHTVMFDNFKSVEVVELNNGGKKMVLRSDPVFLRAGLDAYQDRCEGCDFASIGGKNGKVDTKYAHAPTYIHENDNFEYLVGYFIACDSIYGNRWRKK